MKLMRLTLACVSPSRSPRGERGLKHEVRGDTGQGKCRSPRGERGLKRAEKRLAIYLRESLPARGAWIETLAWHIGRPGPTVAPRAGSVD